MAAPCRVGVPSQGAGTSSQARTPVAAAVRFVQSPGATGEVPNTDGVSYSTKKSGLVT